LRGARLDGRRQASLRVTIEGVSTSRERMARLRERRAAALEADPDAARLRDADELLSPAVAETIGALGLDGQDAAAARLALRYAQIIDECRDPSWGLRWIGPELLRVLAELGATPLSRVKVRKDTGPREPSALDRLRQARRTV
jgi:hypothetical protein